MPNAFYPLWKEDLLAGLISGDVKVALIDTADESYNAADDFLNDVTGAGIVATSGNLGSKTATNGVFDAADVTFSAVSGDSVEAMVLYLDTGVSSTSRLICFIDTGTNLPITPNGGDITVSWDNGSNKIFAL